MTTYLPSGYDRIQKTRFTDLGYAKFGYGYWRLVALDDDNPAVIGPHYTTKAELLGDLTRYAREAGYVER